MKAPKDPRLGLTSASNAEADSLCPGRYLAQRGLPEERSALAQFGSETHAAFAGEDVELSVSQERILEMAAEIEANVIRHVFGEEAIGAPDKEKRLWIELEDGSGLKHSGQCDKVFVGDEKILIEDLKSLRGDVALSPENLQLRDEAVLAWNEYSDCQTVSVFINQPMATRTPIITTYDLDDLGTAWFEMQQRIKASHDPKSSRVPGVVQCRYCRARGTCPEAIKWAKTSTAMMLPKEPKQIVKELAPEQCVQIWDKRRTLYAILDGIEDRLKALPEKRLEKLGLRIKPGPVRETITNPNALFERLECYGVKVSEFTAIVKVPKSGVSDLLRSHTEAKGKELDQLVKNVVDGLTEGKETKATLERIKD